MEIKIDAKKAIKGLNEMIKGIEDLTPIMEYVAARAREIVDENFEKEGRDETGAERVWAPLSKTTQEYRAKVKGEQYAAHPILQLTGVMRSRIYTDYGKDFAVVYSSVEYAVQHHTGRDNMPARPFLVIPKPEWDEMREKILTLIMRLWER